MPDAPRSQMIATVATIADFDDEFERRQNRGEAGKKTGRPGSGRRRRGAGERPWRLSPIVCESLTRVGFISRSFWSVALLKNSKQTLHCLVDWTSFWEFILVSVLVHSSIHYRWMMKGVLMKIRRYGITL